jgi:hypothetical protein
MRRARRILRQWIPLALVITAMCGLMYLTVQQLLRQGANDPQIQMAEDAAVALSGGAAVDSILPANQVDLSKSIAPFLVIYSRTGVPVASSGLLDGQMPYIPLGIFDYVQKNGQDRVTWQPEANVRIAAVVVEYSGDEPGFVLAGRSLREAEARDLKLRNMIGLVGISTMVGSLVVVALNVLYLTERRSRKED